MMVGMRISNSSASATSRVARLFRALAATAVAAGIGHQAFAAGDTADEARSINQQVLGLIKDTKLAEASELAKRGLALCDDAGSVKAFCAGQFNELLGDIAYRQSHHVEALEYYQRAFAEREPQVGHDNRLVALTQFRIARTLAALHRNDDAEAAFKDAIAILEKRRPIEPELGQVLFELQKLYILSNRPAQAVDVARRKLDAYIQIQGPDGKTVVTAKTSLGTALASLGSSQFNRKDYDGAELSLQEGLPLMDPPPAGWEGIFEASLIFLGKIYDMKGRYPEAEQIELHGLEYSEKARGPADPYLPPLLTKLASHYDDAQNPDKAIAYARRAVTILDERKQEDQTLGTALISLGRAQRKLGQYTEADAAFARAKVIIDRVVPEDDPRRADVRNDIAILRSNQERYGEAEQEYRAALTLQERFAYQDSTYRSTFLAGLGYVYRDTARYREAEQVTSEALKIDEAAAPARTALLGKRLTLLASIFRREARYVDAISLLKRTLAMTLPDIDRADALNSLGLIYSTIGQYSDAEPLLSEALALRRNALPADDPLTLETVGNLADIDLAMARFADGEAKRRDVLRRIEAREPPQSTLIALDAVLLANTLISTGKLDEAEILTKRAITLYENRLGPDHPRTGGTVKTLAAIEALQGRDQAAENSYRRALGVDERTFGLESAAIAGDLVGLCPILRRLGKYQEAKTGLTRALAIMTGQFGDDSPMVLSALTTSANAAYEEARYGEARELADRARKIRERTSGPDHPSLVASWIFSERLDVATGRLEIAGTEIDRAAAIAGKTLNREHPFHIDILEGRADLAVAHGDLAAAEQDNRQALALAAKLFKLDHPVRQGAGDRVVSALWANGKFAEAEQLRRDQLAELARVRQDGHPSIARALRQLAAVLANSARTDEAITLYKRALTMDEQAFGAGSREAGTDHLALGSFLTALGHFDEARLELNHVRTIAETENNRPLQIEALAQLAGLAEMRGGYAEGLVHIERMVDIAAQMLGNDSPALNAALAQLGKRYVLTRQVENGEEIVERIKRSVGEDPPEQSPGYFDILQLRAMLAVERKDLQQAEAYFKRAIAFATKYGGPQAGTVGSIKFNLAIAYLKTERFAEALANFTAALVIWKRQSGDHAPIVGYTLMGAAKAYAGLGDKAKSEALTAAAIEILGPIIASRPEPKWL